MSNLTQVHIVGTCPIPVDSRCKLSPVESAGVRRASNLHIQNTPMFLELTPCLVLYVVKNILQADENSL